MWKEKIENQKRKLEIIDSIKPIFLYFLLSGVFPYKIEQCELKFSKLGMFLATLNLCIMLFGYYHLFIGDPFNEVISKIEQIQFATVSISLLILFICQFKVFKTHMDTAFTIGGQIIDTDKMKKKLKILVGCEIFISSFFITALHVGPVLMSAVNYTIVYDRLDNKLYIYFLFFTNNLFLLQCIAINFMFYLKECFYYTNHQIISMVNDMSLITNGKVAGVVNIFNGSVERNAIHKLKRLVKIRQKLFELTMNVNKMWYILLICCSWISLFEILFSAFYAIVFIFDENSFDDDQTNFHNYLVAWMLYHAFSFIFMCCACDQVTQEVRNIYYLNSRGLFEEFAT